MKSSLFRRRKLTFFFLLGVGLPSLALSLLALRGIQNELALLEQRQLDEYRGITQQISDSLQTRIEWAEAALSRTLASLDGEAAPASGSARVQAEAAPPGTVAGQESGPAPPLGRTLDSLRALHPLIDVVFFLEKSGRIELSAADLLYRSDTDSHPPAVVPDWPPEASEQMRRGQEEEFQRNDPAQALARYRRAYHTASHPVLQGRALLAMTRIQRKAGSLEDAISCCDSLLLKYESVPTGEGMPLGAVALLEKGSMLLAGGDSIQALGTLLELYRKLVAGGWDLRKAQYEFFCGQVTATMSEIPGLLGGPRVDSMASVLAGLQQEESNRRDRAERALFFTETSGEDLLVRVQTDSETPGSFPMRVSLENGGRTFLVSLFGGHGPTPGTWGFLLDGQFLREDLLLPMLQAGVDDSVTEWILRGRDGRTVLASGTSRSGDGGFRLEARDSPVGSPVMSATLAGRFPPWLLEFYRAPQSPYRMLLASGQSVYLYMFLAIAAILGFGLVMTIRTITQELELARLKSDFVSTVSHEFKSPLSSIRQLSEMLQSGRVPSEERRQRYYDILVEQSARLSALITNVLDLARIEEGRKEFRFEALDTAALLLELAEATQHRVGVEGFEIVTRIQEPLPQVRADPEALRQAVSNLLNNAVQYSGKSRRVELVASAERGDPVTVMVKDFGVGIPEEELGRVFDRFYRGSGETTRSVRGSGLGLTLVKEIAEAHGGTVEVKSEVGQGSTFSIKLPVLREA